MLCINEKDTYPLLPDVIYNDKVTNGAEESRVKRDPSLQSCRVCWNLMWRDWAKIVGSESKEGHNLPYSWRINVG